MQDGCSPAPSLLTPKGEERRRANSTPQKISNFELSTNPYTQFTSNQKILNPELLRDPL